MPTRIFDDFRRRGKLFLSLTLAAWFVSVSNLAPAEEPVDQKEDSAEKVVPVFKDGEAQVVEGFSDPKEWIQHDLFVETEFDSDGNGKLDRVHVAVTRQKQTDTENLKVPVVYVTSPYFAGTNPTADEDYFWQTKHEIGDEPPKREIPESFDAKGRRPIISRSHIRTWVPRGYAVVHSSSPGTGLSQGCPTVGGDNESLAPKAVIDWLCGRAKGFTEVDNDEQVFAKWCTGKVGMTGTSYNGTLPLAAATTGVEGLEAIIPIAPNTSYYHYYRSNGLVRHPGGYMGEDIDVLYDFIHSGNPDRREWCDCEIRDKEMNENQDRITGDYNDFWAGRDYLNDMAPMKAALFMAHAFNDWNVVPEHSVRIYEAAQAKGLDTRAYFHQGGHGGPPPVAHMNRWFTRYLFDVENGVEKDPKSWVVREEDPRGEPTAYPDYPHPEAKPTPLFFGKGGNKVGGLGLPKEGIGDKVIESWTDDRQYNGPALSKAAESKNRLLYASPKLKEPIHLSGYSEIKLKVSVDREAANLSVWIVSLPWDEDAKRITENIITRGWADPQNTSPRESRPLKPGKFYDVQFRLQPDDQIIPAGQQIAALIFSTDPDFTLQPEPGTKLKIDLGESWLSLPVVGGAEAWEAATK